VVVAVDQRLVVHHRMQRGQRRLSGASPPGRPNPLMAMRSDMVRVIRRIEADIIAVEAAIEREANSTAVRLVGLSDYGARCHNSLQRKP
jgi:hypothetical protein